MKNKIDINQDISYEKKIELVSTLKKTFDTQYGMGTLMRMDNTSPYQVEVVSTGALSLDEALGVGGYARGRIIEIYGPESSGKTTLALHAIAEAQKKSFVCVFIDAEHALDINYAENLGVQREKLWLMQPDSGEQALDSAEQMIRSQGVDLIVIDSVAALIPRSEIDGNMGDFHVGAQARLMSQGLRKLTGILNKTKCSLIFINQIRMKIGVMFGNPETTTGGNALKFFSSVRLEVRKGEQLVSSANKSVDDKAFGNKIKVKVVKNKISPPFRKVELDLIYGKGVSYYADLLDMAVKYNFIGKSGSWFSYGEDKIGQGRENAMKYLQENKDLAQSIYSAIRSKLFFEDESNPVSFDNKKKK